MSPKSKNSTVQTQEDFLDLFMKQDEKTKKQIFTVSELNAQIKIILEDGFAAVWVEGEVSGISKISTGTTFFSLKDSSSLLKCVIFPSHVHGLKFDLKDGIKVICFGHISLYEKTGQYQLYIEKIEPQGIGSLQLAFEQLKEKLEKEGLFAIEHKRTLPYLPAKIGIITSFSGAALKDMLKVLERRFKDVHIVIRSCLVQGEAAKEDIVEAIREINEYNESLTEDNKIEVLIVGRGGGSIEDLWSFNEEIVVRAIYNSKIPVISAVGHERDFTISDMVADLRAATPSVAAEIILPQKEDLINKVKGSFNRITNIIENVLAESSQNLEDNLHRLKVVMSHSWQFNSHKLEIAVSKLYKLNPAIVIPDLISKVDDLARQIHVRMMHLLEIKEMDFSSGIEKLGSLNPLNILNRGYSVTFRLDDNFVVKDTKVLKEGDLIKTRFFRGEIVSKVCKIETLGQEN